MRRDFSESAPPIALPASRTRSPEASMGHLPGNPAEEPDSARSGGHLPGKSPWADAGGALRHRPGALGPSAGGRMRAFPAGFDDSDAVRASGGRSWPSQSEAGAARTRFPRRPRGGVCHRASARSHNGWRHRASLGASSGVRHRVSLGPSGVAASRERPRRPSAIFHIVTIRSLNRDFAYRICVAC